MRTRFHVFVNTADIDPGRLRALLDEAEVFPERISKPGALGVYEAIIADDLLGAARLRDLLRRNGVESFLRHSRSLSTAEILAAPLSVVSVVRAERGRGGPRYGTRFALEEACPRCGTGARAIGDLVLKAGDLPKTGDVFQTLDHEYCFSDRVRDALIEADVTGAEFHTVRTSVTDEPVPWAQLVAPLVLPPADPETSGGVRREDPCPECKRDGYFGTAESPLELRYSMLRVDVERLSDLASTWEHFGLSRLVDPFEDSTFAQPLLVAKPRVIETLIKLKVRGLAFDPVAISD